MNLFIKYIHTIYTYIHTHICTYLCMFIIFVRDDDDDDDQKILNVVNLKCFRISTFDQKMRAIKKLEKKNC